MENPKVLLNQTIIKNNEPVKAKKEVSFVYKKNESIKLELPNTFNNLVNYRKEAEIDIEFLGDISLIESDNEKMHFQFHGIGKNYNDVKSDEAKIVFHLNYEMSYDIIENVSISKNHIANVCLMAKLIDNFEMSYKAKLYVSGKGPKFLNKEKDNQINNPETLKAFMSKYNLNLKFIDEKKVPLIMEISGKLNSSFPIPYLFVRPFDFKCNETEH